MSSPGRPAYRFYQWFWAGLDWLFPPTCGGCGERGTRWCSDCQRKTRIVSSPFCPHCGEMQVEEGLCARCKTSPPHYAALRSWGVFEDPLRSAMHRLKYRRDVALGEILSRPLLELFVQLGWVVDLVTPVPMGVARQAQRGYNQAALLARPLALGSGHKYMPNALCKARETPSQVGLTLEQRRLNVAGAFLASQEIVSCKSVLVVDDVTTSGATMETCAEALLAAGAERVYGLTLARA